MGGINHQPCREYLDLSTGLSRQISQAIAAFWQSNVAIEDLILAELAKRHSTLDAALGHLTESDECLRRGLDTLEDLERRMDDLSYQDVPELGSQAVLATGLALCKTGAIEQNHWDNAWLEMKSGGFRQMLQKFREEVTELRGKTATLVTGLRLLVGEEFTIVPEENRVGNFKIPFAQLLTAWQAFIGLFAASSLITTEAWYKHNGYGSLVAPATVSV
jgi:hypothetical protein